MGSRTDAELIISKEMCKEDRDHAMKIIPDFAIAYLNRKITTVVLGGM